MPETQTIPELTNFRKKYPMYDDLDDSTIASKLAAKYPDAYGDLPDKIKTIKAETPDFSAPELGDSLELTDTTAIQETTAQPTNFNVPEEPKPAELGEPLKMLAQYSPEVAKKMVEKNAGAGVKEPRPIDENMTEGLIPKTDLENSPLGRMLGMALSTPLTMAEGIAGVGEYAGIPGAKETGDQLQNWARTLSPENPDLAEKIVGGVASAATFFIPGIGAAKGVQALSKLSPKVANLFGLGAMNFLESATEAGSVYRESNDPTAAEKTFLANAILIGVTNRYDLTGQGKATLKKILLQSGLEGIQEGGQSIISSKSQDKDVNWDEVLESAGIGALIGGGATTILPQQKQQLEQAGISEEEINNLAKEFRVKASKPEPQEGVTQEKLPLDLQKQRYEQTGATQEQLEELEGFKITPTGTEPLVGATQEQPIVSDYIEKTAREKRLERKQQREKRKYDDYAFGELTRQFKNARRKRNLVDEETLTELAGNITDPKAKGKADRLVEDVKKSNQRIKQRNELTLENLSQRTFGTRNLNSLDEDQQQNILDEYNSMKEQGFESFGKAELIIPQLKPFEVEDTDPIRVDQEVAPQTTSELEREESQRSIVEDLQQQEQPSISEFRTEKREDEEVTPFDDSFAASELITQELEKQKTAETPIQEKPTTPKKPSQTAQRKPQETISDREDIIPTLEPQRKEIEAQYGKLEDLSTTELRNIAKNMPKVETNKFEKTIAPKVENLSLAEVKTDEDRFQNRALSYSPRTVKAITESYSPAKFDPVVVWRDPADKQTYVLSGHSRLEGMKRRKADEIPVRYFEGSEDEAIEFARLEANRSASAEDLLEDIKAYKFAKEKNYTKKQLEDLFPNGQYRALDDLSKLNPKGQFLSNLNTESRTTFPYLERNARWVGQAKEQFPKLTDAHETEMFDFFYREKDKNLRIKKDEFFDAVEKQVNRADFDENTPLNLESAKKTTGLRARADTADLQKQIDELVTRKKEAITDKEREAINGKIEKLRERINDITSSQLTLMEEAGSYSAEENRPLLIRVSKEYGKYPLNSPRLGKYSNSEMPTTKVMNRLKDLDLLETVKDFNKKLNRVKGRSPQEQGQDFELLARITLKEAESAPEMTFREDREEYGVGNILEPTETFYSKLQKVTEQKAPGTISTKNVDQYLSMLKKNGVKDEEIEWIDVEGFVKEQGKVSKDELVDFIQQNNVRIEEVEKGENNEYSLANIKDAEIDYRGSGYWIVSFNNELESVEFPLSKADDKNEAYKYALDLVNYDTPQASKGKPKFSQWQEPGGENYRELLLTMPIGKFYGDFQKYKAAYKKRFPNSDASDMSIQSYFEEMLGIPTEGGRSEQVFSSPHFDEPNILAHVRMNDRTDAEGRKILFIEEVQSDWHQQGREKGYNDPQKQKRYVELDQKRINEKNLTEAETRELAELEESEQIKVGGLVPNAPFKKTWHELALKRMLRYAAENGYDGISWTTGEMQADRYDLSKRVDKIDWNPKTQTLVAYKDGKTVLTQKNVTENNLSDYVGKEPAKKLIDAEPYIEGTPNKKIEGENLKVGGEGMEGFYDKMIPSFLNKYAKKWGAKVGETEIETSGTSQEDRFEILDEEGNIVDRAQTEMIANDLARQRSTLTGGDFTVRDTKKIIGKAKTVPFLPITESMKESVITEGQPLFETPEQYGREGASELTKLRDYKKHLELAKEEIKKKFNDYEINLINKLDYSQTKRVTDFRDKYNRYGDKKGVRLIDANLELYKTNKAIQRLQKQQKAKPELKGQQEIFPESKGEPEELFGEKPIEEGKTVTVKKEQLTLFEKRGTLRKSVFDREKIFGGKNENKATLSRIQRDLKNASLTETSTEGRGLPTDRRTATVQFEPEFEEGVQLPKRTIPEEARKVLKEWREKGEVSLVGTQLSENYIQDVADSYRIFRDPFVEVTHIIGRDKNNKIVANVAVSSSASNYVYLRKSQLGEIAQTLKDKGAVKATLLHNHPSGNPTPSKADIKTAAFMKVKFSENDLDLDSSVVINGDEYAAWTLGSEPEFTPKFYKYKSPKIHPLDDFYKNFDSFPKIKIRSDVAPKYLAQLKYGDGNVAVVIMDNKNYVRGYEYIHKDLINNNEEFGKYVDKVLESHGGSQIIIAGKEGDINIPELEKIPDRAGVYTAKELRTLRSDYSWKPVAATVIYKGKEAVQVYEYQPVGASRAAETVRLEEGRELKFGIGADIYAENRKTKGDGVITSVKEATKHTNDFLKDKLVPLSTRIKNISPSLKNRLREFEFDLGKEITVQTRRVHPFLHQASKLDKNTRADLDLALKNGDKTKIDEIVKNNNLEEDYKEVRTLLDELYNKALDVGIDLGYRKNYHPRSVKKPKEFIRYFENSGEWNRFKELIENKEAEIGRVLSLDEKVNLINNALRGYNDGISLSKTSNLKERKIPIIDAELNKFYNDSYSALLGYINSVNELIEARKFFGKKEAAKVSSELTDIREKSTEVRKLKRQAIKNPNEITIGDYWRAYHGLDVMRRGSKDYQERLKARREKTAYEKRILKGNQELVKEKTIPVEEFNIDNSIGNYVMDLIEKDQLNIEQADELERLLKARFKQKGTGGIITDFKNIGYVVTLGSPTSAITQIGDLAIPLYRTGPLRTLQALGQAIFNRSNVNLEELGISPEKIAEEFADPRRRARIVRKVFKATGFTKVDVLGKETLINATLKKYQKQAKKPSKEFTRRLENVFEGETDQLIKDLQNKEISENVKLLLFNELLDTQPIALSEMPEGYLTAGNGRIFYMLKTFFIRRIDYYRNETFKLMKNKETRAEGIKNLIYLTSAIMLMEAGADELKDLLLGRETSLKDRVVDNVARIVGFSKYSFDQIQYKGFFRTLGEMIIPPFDLLDDFGKDLLSFLKGKEIKFRTIKNIPVLGKVAYYWWFKDQKKRKSKLPKAGR